MNIEEFIEDISKETYEKWKTLNPEVAKILTYDQFKKDSLMGKHIEYVSILLTRGEQIIKINSCLKSGVPLGYLKRFSNNSPTGYIYTNNDGTFWLLHPLHMLENPYKEIKSLDEIGLCNYENKEEKLVKDSKIKGK